MYLTCSIPCSPCLVEIINAGIKEIVVTKMEYYDIMSEYLLKHSKLLVRQYEFMKGD
jgi:deoxycytidylate deaminase